MLVRDFGFCIYKALLACSDKAQADKKQDDNKKKGDGKKRDEKKCGKDSADQQHKDSSETKTGGDEVKTITEVLVDNSQSAAFNH